MNEMQGGPCWYCGQSLDRPGLFRKCERSHARPATPVERFADGVIDVLRVRKGMWPDLDDDIEWEIRDEIGQHLLDFMRSHRGEPQLAGGEEG